MATVHGEDGQEAFTRGFLIAAAPIMRNWLQAAVQVFELIATEDRGPAGEAAPDMLPGLRDALMLAGWGAIEGPIL